MQESAKRTGLYVGFAAGLFMFVTYGIGGAEFDRQYTLSDGIIGAAGFAAMAIFGVLRNQLPPNGGKEEL